MKLSPTARMSLAVPVIALALAGCGADDEAPSQASPTPATSQASASVNTAPATETPTDAGATATTGTATAMASTERLPGFPEAVESEHGKQAWNVIVAAGKSTDPSIDKAQQNVKAAGYGDVGSTTCLQGGAKVAGLPGADGDHTYVTLAFPNEAAARAFAAAYRAKFGGEVAGVGQVTEFCLD